MRLRILDGITVEGGDAVWEEGEVSPEIYGTIRDYAPGWETRLPFGLASKLVQCASGLSRVYVEEVQAGSLVRD